jgi:CBS domain containing-hemolysin-like protein
MKVDADNGSKSAKAVLKLLDKYDHILTVTLVGNNIVSVIVSAVATVMFYKYFTTIGLETYASVISTIVITFTVYIFGDTLPKTIAKAIPDTISKFVAFPILILSYILYPIGIVFSFIIKGIGKIFKVKEEPTITEEDITNALEQSADDEVLTDEQTEIINSALDFVDTNVKEVLTLKDKMFALNIDSLTHEKLNEILLETNYSRIPIYKGNINNIIGVLHTRTYLEQYLKDNNISIKSTLQKPYFVNTKIMIDDIFNGFKKNHVHIAIVKDDSGDVVGMVTMEDILEELVSDISEPSKEGGNKK